MNHGYRRVGERLLKGHEQGQRTAQSRTTADDHYLLAFHFNLVVLEHLANACRGTGYRSRLLQHQAAEVDRMQAVGIFVGIHQQQGFVEVETAGQGILNDIGIHVRTVVKVLDRRQQIGLTGTGRNLNMKRSDPHRFAGLALFVDIADARTIIANQNGPEAGGNSPSFHHRDATCNIFQDRFSDHFSFQQFRCHENSLSNAVKL